MVRIYRMTATFGRLDNETLTLTPGLNIFTAPNEAGKSTWAAFLLAMLYGIDTASRAKKGAIPDKAKYLPWSGKPMEGLVDLHWNGRDITIRRKSDNRTPMGIFTALDTRSGDPVAELTAENCGKVLLGVERSVFARSAFIGQNALAVIADAALEQRLLQLVTTGDESVSFIDTEKRLREWKNHVRHNKTGYLPETESKLAALEAQLAAHRQNEEEITALYTQLQALSAEHDRLQYIEENLLVSEAVQKKQQLAAAEAAYHHTQNALAEARSAAEKLPSFETLSDMGEELRRLGENRRTKRLFPLWITAAILLLCSAAAWYCLPMAAYVLLPLAILFFGLWIFLFVKQRKKSARHYQQENSLLTAVRSFADNIYTSDDAAQAITAAQENLTELSSLQAQAAAAKSAYDTLAAVFGPITQATPAEDFTDRYTLQEVRLRLAQVTQTLHDAQTELARLTGASSALGKPEELMREKEVLCRRKAILEQRNAALSLALETLGNASEKLRRRFSPQVAAKTAELLNRMTGGRYDAVRVEQDMTLHARQTGKADLRQLLTLSGGTADQLYLALRLAISRLAVADGAPLILDDALVYFDDARLAETLELLKEESDHRQILLFTCQSREADYIKKTP